MLFYNFNSLDDFIKNELMISVQSEADKLNKIENLYKSEKYNLLTTTTDIMSTTAENISENKLQEFYKVVDLLKKSFEELDLICNIADTLKNSLDSITSLHDKNIDNNYNEIKANLIEYNKISDQLSNKIFEFENNCTYALASAFEYFSSTNKKIKTSTKKNFVDYSISTNPLLKNIETSTENSDLLLISEKEQKAYLPYKYNKVKNIFENSKDKYKTMQDVINDLYIIPLSKFKNSSISRFREAFHLIRNKENSSITKALDLGLELMFKYELNPIVIAACRNLDELDIYLDCLDNNELYEFSCFDIKFEVMPQISKKNKKNIF